MAIAERGYLYMNIENIYNIENEEKRISALYDIFDEGTRLSTKATQIEFLTTVKQIEKHLELGMKILDLGAGTGEYSLYFAKKGFEVTAIELVEKHVIQIKEKINSEMSLKVFSGNAIDISMIKDKSYDIVLCFGPLYHLAKIEDRMKCIEEVKRVCKDNGKMFFAFISNDMAIATQTMCKDSGFIKGDSYNHKNFKIKGILFVFHTVEECRKLLRDSDLIIKTEVAADGLSELLADKINNMNDENYRLWLNYHYYYCEKPEFLGASNHLLFITEKRSLLEAKVNEV
jgi:2-polyprenyl-3-methyl-5-hydroxy-6-metoxy-1,4-benzoquinol methylase